MADIRGVLHVCNDFLWTKVHRNLYAHLDSLGVRQEVFTPLRKHSNKDNNRLNLTVPGSAVRYSGVLSAYHRVFFGQKIRKLYADLEALNIVDGCDIVHPTTLFSDGALAYEIFRKYKKPYVVTVRNTDINMFLKYKPHLIFLARKILDNAERLVFISESNFENFFNHPLLRMQAHDYRSKAMVINNGIDRFWLDNLHAGKKASAKEILFIGRFDRNKNVLRLIRAFLALGERYPGLKLRLVGEAGEHEGKVRQLVARHEGRILYHGHVVPGPELLKICRECDVFAMVSHYETFGLVYVEALSQGLPVLFTAGQGIDGSFSENIGVAVNPRSVADIRHGLEYLIDNYHSFDTGKISFRRFDWEHIARTYLEIYSTLLTSVPRGASTRC